MRVIKARALRKGDVIGLVCPAGPPDRPEKIEHGVRYLEQLGYRVKLGAHVAEQRGYLAGNDEQRLDDLNRMIRDPEVRAIFAIRGGYGCSRLLPGVDYRALARDPKIIAGFSDITGLQLAIFRKIGLVTFSGPMPGVEFWKSPDPYTEENFWKVVTARKKTILRNPPKNPASRLRTGSMEGRLLGGNLSLAVSLLGTPFCPRFRGAILVLEEVDEYPHRIDRMLAQLRNAGVLKEVSGVCLGQFTLCEPKDPAKPHLTTAEVLADLAAWTAVPMLGNLQYGHIGRKLTIPLGVRARCSARSPDLILDEAAVA